MLLVNKQKLIHFKVTVFPHSLFPIQRDACGKLTIHISHRGQVATYKTINHHYSQMTGDKMNLSPVLLDLEPNSWDNFQRCYFSCLHCVKKCIQRDEDIFTEWHSTCATASLGVNTIAYIYGLKKKGQEKVKFHINLDG